MDSSSQNAKQRRDKPKSLAPINASAFSMDVGLSKITTIHNQKRRMHLPAAYELEPSEGKMEDRLRGIVDLSTFNAVLIGALRPDVRDRRLLSPVVFRNQVAQLKNSLWQELRASGKSLDPQLEELLTRLEKQLTEEQGKNELLEQYRLMILMG